MNNEISRIIKNLMDHYYNNDNSEKKYLSIEIHSDKKFDDGNIRIDASGKWVERFNVQLFRNNVWNYPPQQKRNRKVIFVRLGDCKIPQYELYKINVGQICTSQLEEEAYVENCEFYVSFVFEINERTLKNKFPVIKHYVKDLANIHKDLRIDLKGSDQFWEEDKKIEGYINLIGGSISTILTYSTNNSGDLYRQTFNVSTNGELVEKFEQTIFQRYLKYNGADL